MSSRFSVFLPNSAQKRNVATADKRLWGSGAKRMEKREFSAESRHHSDAIVAPTRGQTNTGQIPDPLPKGSLRQSRFRRHRYPQKPVVGMQISPRPPGRRPHSDGEAADRGLGAEAQRPQGRRQQQDQPKAPHGAASCPNLPFHGFTSPALRSETGSALPAATGTGTPRWPPRGRGRRGRPRRRRRLPWDRRLPQASSPVDR